MELAVEVPRDELGPVATNEMWGEIYDRVADLIRAEPHHAGLRQHAPPGRARGPPPGRAPGRKRRAAASRQPLARAAPGSRAAAQERRTARRGGHRLARAGHRYRHGGPGLPDRLAALHRGGAAAHRPRRPLGGRAAQGPPLRHHARRADRMRRPGARHPPRRARPPGDSAQRARHPGAADGGRLRLRRFRRRRAVRPGAPRLALPHAGARAISTQCWRCSPRASPPRAAAAAPTCIATP